MAEVTCLAEYLVDEMRARGWRSDDVARRMKTPNGAAMDLFCLDLLLAVQNDALIIDDAMFVGLGHTFDVSADLFRNLHLAWVTNKAERVPFECPDEIFGPTSRRAMIRAVK